MINLHLLNSDQVTCHRHSVSPGLMTQFYTRLDVLLYILSLIVGLLKLAITEFKCVNTTPVYSGLFKIVQKHFNNKNEIDTDIIKQTILTYEKSFVNKY